MQLKCGQCSAPFRSENLRLDRGIAICAACGSVQRLPVPANTWGARSDRGGEEFDEESDSPRDPKFLQEVPTPAGFRVEDDGFQFSIHRRWFHPMLFFLLFFAIAWDSFLVGWYGMLVGGPFGGRNGMPGAFQLVFFLFPLIHVAVGVGLTYYVIAGFLNTTVIRVTDGFLTVRHRPVPWFGPVDIPVDSIQQIYCKKKMHQHRNKNHGHVSTSFQFQVHAVLDGQDVKLLSGLIQPEHALFIEQKLEQHLKIEDRRVGGEMESP